MKAVLDVGQFVSSTIHSRGHPAQILSFWRAGKFELVTSPPILDDLRRVLHYPHIRKRHQWSDETIELFVSAIGVAAILTPGKLEVSVVKRDSSDDKVLACAKEGNLTPDDTIVSSDEHLAELIVFSGIPIVPPRLFLERLQREFGQNPGQTER